MTLALLILVSLLSAACLARIAAKTRLLPPAMLVMAVITVPLICFAYMQTRARPLRSPLSFEVLGQFHVLAAGGTNAGADSAPAGRDSRNTITFGAAAGSDVVLRDSPMRVDVAYDIAAAAFTVHVREGDEPVVWAGRPVNGAPLGRSATISTADRAIAIRITRSWWCWFRCGAFTAHYANGRTQAIDLDAGPARLEVGPHTATVFRAGTRAFIAADPASGLRVNARPLPDQLQARGDSLHIGVPGRGPAFALRADPAQNRIDVLFGRNTGRERWDFPAELPADARVLVAASVSDTIPGVGFIMNPAEVAPGAARQPYGGILERAGDQWTWRHGGRSERVTIGSTVLLPGRSADRTAGHIVQLSQRETDPRTAWFATMFAWLTGALFLAGVWRYTVGTPLALRLAATGTLYTLLFVRATLAFRAWLAPPHNSRVIGVVLSVLIALPALAGAYHAWERARTRTGRRVSDALLPALPVLLFLTIALGGVLWLVVPEWRGAIVLNTLAPLILGTGGLWLLQRLLIAPHLSEKTHGPLAPLQDAAARDYTYRQFVTAVAALVLIGFTFAVISRVVGQGRIVAITATMVAVLGLAWANAAFAAFVRPARNRVRAVFAAAAALVGGGGTFWISQSMVLAVPIALGAGTIAWFTIERGRPRIRPFALRECIRPGLLVAVFGGLVLLISAGLLERVRVLVGYGLAIAGMIVVTRMFAILWFRQSDHAARISIRAQAQAPYRLPSLLGLAVVFGLTLAVYTPLGLTDPGLLLLFFSAAAITAVIGLSATGPRGIAAGVSMLGVIVLAFFFTMQVWPDTLRQERPIALTTPELRYAAALFPEDLQRHLVAADVGTAREILNTLQQDWGMRHYAALGGTTGHGYFGADFLDRGVTAPVALAENSFAAFVLSEHGWIGGVAVLFVYIALVAVLLGAALVACDQASAVPRALLLSGLAAFWAVPSLYMIAANASVLPLTGQNVPWLGLLSPADGALGVLLGALALHTLPQQTHGLPGRALPLEARLRRVRKAISAMLGVFVAVGVAVAAAMWKPLHEQPDDFRLDTFIARVEDFVRSRAIVPGDSIAVAAAARDLPAFQPQSFLSRVIGVSNAMARGERDPVGYCYAQDPLLRVTSGGDIAIMRAFCGLGTTTGSRYAWRGILRSPTTGDDMVLTDGLNTVVFEQRAARDALVGSTGSCDEGMIRARSARIGCDSPVALVRFGSSTLTFEPLDSAAPVLNAKAASGVTLLQPGDRITGADGSEFMVMHVPRGALSYARWENGTWRRVPTLASSPWLQQVDAQIARALATRNDVARDAIVSIHADLHVQLDDRLKEACANTPGATSCSALIANPRTGGILAVAEWRPRPLPPNRFRALDANLRNHPPASAIKPIVGAAAIRAYPKLLQLEVDHDARSYRLIANVNVGDSMRANRRYPQRRVPWNGFLGGSDNLYAASLGFLAGARPGSAGLPQMRGSGNPSGLFVGGRALEGRPVFPGGKGLGLARSPFAHALAELYDITTSGPAPAYDENFWKAAIDAGVLRRNADIQRISPDAVSVGLDEVDTPRTLASFMIGGASNRWNNVALVQAFSRLFTGTNVSLYLLHAVGDRTLAPQPAEDPALKAVMPHVRTGLKSVTNAPWGTAYSLRDAFPSARVDWVAKTGTLAEREWTGSVFLWAGEAVAGTAGVCPAAGIIVVELENGTVPDGKATAIFRNGIAELLREHRGWGTAPAGSCS